MNQPTHQFAVKIIKWNLSPDFLDKNCTMSIKIRAKKVTFQNNRNRVRSDESEQLF